jgi:hypothetical protein
MLCAAGALLIQGCGDDDPTEEEGLYPPSFLQIEEGCGENHLNWDLSADDGNENFAGYMIFRDTYTLEDLTADDALNYYIGQVNAGEDTYIDVVSNEVAYYYQVRAFDEDNEFSNGSDAGPTSIRLQGTGRVYENASSIPTFLLMSEYIS